jgi:predicted nucleic acid-binding protein
MLLVLDNTVMSNFALVDRVDWLRRAWPGMLVTSNEAWAELQAGIRLGRLRATEWSWLSVLTLTVQERQLRDELVPPLDEGEAACLALAQRRGYGLLTDDRVARREARRMGVSLSGTLGVLQSLVHEGQVPLEEADAALLEMIARGYRSPVPSLSGY